MGQSFHPEEMLNKGGRQGGGVWVWVCMRVRTRAVGEGSGSGHVSGLSLSTLAAVKTGSLSEGEVLPFGQVDWSQDPPDARVTDT